MIGKIYCTRKGADKLRQEKDALVNRLRSIQGQKGEAAETGGNVWHDNFAFEDLCRQELMLNKQIEDVNIKLAQMTVIEDTPSDCEKARIGHILHLRVGDKPMTVIVGGFGESELDAEPPVLSYMAPLVKGLLGKEVGAKITARIEETQEQIILERIELPPKRRD